jgi:hypothetical protein
MNRILFLPALVLLVAGLVLGAPLPARSAPKIDAQADQYLKQMCSFLAGLKAFSFSAEETLEEPRAAGQLVELSNRRRVTVARPNQLAAELTGDSGSRRFFYDGKTVTLLDRTANVYGTVPAPATTDAMLDDLFQRVGVSVPLADLLFPDPYKVLTEPVQSGTYVGTNRVGNVRCHHLAFRNPTLDWQIWIDAGEKPLPRRLAIRFTQAPGAPRYAATLDDWDLSPQLSDATFAFQPPAGAQKIDFLPVPPAPARNTGRTRR